MSSLIRFKQANGFENILSHQNSQCKPLSKTFPFLKAKKNFKVITSAKEALGLGLIFLNSIYFSFSPFVPFVYFLKMFVYSFSPDRETARSVTDMSWLCYRLFALKRK